MGAKQDLGDKFRMNTANKVEMYHDNQTYLEGWYTIEDLKRILQTAEKINDLNKQITQDFTQNQTSG
jgi:hypothetical protein